MTTDPQTPVEDLSGRELDAAVAEEVFGVENADRRWRPSTDISDAWEVLERFDHQDLLHDSEARDSRWSVTVRRYLPREKYIEEWAEHSEVEVAICRAALRAVRQ